MAYDIIGTIFRIGAVENVNKKVGGTFPKRQLILMQRRFDRNTGQEFEPNYPTIEFTHGNTAKLDSFNVGDVVRVQFDLSGTKTTDQATGADKFFTSAKGFNIERYARPGQYPQAQVQVQPAQVQQPQNYVPPQQWQQPPQQPAPPPQQTSFYPAGSPTNDPPF